MIGIDLIKTSRMEKFIEKFQDKALKKFLSTSEIDLVKNHTTAAGFWAVKEAASKALGVGIGAECAFHDILISKTPKGAPVVTFSQHILDNYNIADISASITHDGDYAVAVVAIEKLASTNKI